MHPRFYLIVFLSFLSPFFYSQNKKADSLIRVIKNNPADTTKLKALNLLSNAVRSKDPDESYRIAEEALQLARKIKNRKGEVYALSSIGIIKYTIRHDYQTSVADF